MIKVERILCPTDLSTESDEALRYGVALAHAYKAELLLLHCSEDNPVGTEENGRKFDSQINRVFAASLAPHLGLAAAGDLKWKGLVRGTFTTSERQF